MRAPQNNANSAGFTLIEVMIALAILALAISGSARLISDAYQHIALTGKLQRAYYLADSHLRSLETQQLQTGMSRGAYSNDGSQPELTWILQLERLSVADMPDANSDISKQLIALRADLSVELPEHGRRVELSTLLFTAPEVINLLGPTLIETPR